MMQINLREGSHTFRKWVLDNVLVTRHPHNLLTERKVGYQRWSSSSSSPRTLTIRQYRPDQNESKIVLEAHIVDSHKLEGRQWCAFCSKQFQSTLRLAGRLGTHIPRLIDPY